jgi:hypothetical protein
MIFSVLAQVRNARMRLLALAVLCVCGYGLGLATTAPAHVINLIAKTGYVDGTGSHYVDGTGTTRDYALNNDWISIAIHQDSDRLMVFSNGYVPTNPDEPGAEYWQGILSRFKLDGTPEPFSAGNGTNTFTHFPGYDGAIAVDNSGTASDGNFYFLTWTHKIYGYDSSGTPLGGYFPVDFGESIRGIAVDSTGSIWVTTSSSLVQLDSTGARTGTEIHLSEGPGAIAIDGSDNFYVGLGRGVVKYDKTGAELYEFAPPSAGNIAVDSANGLVYLTGGEGVREFTASGEYIGSFPEAGPLAVDEDTHDIYVSGGKTYATSDPDVRLYHVEKYHNFGLIHLPDVATGEADFTPATATLHGTVNPDTVDTTECYFEWGPTTTEGFSQGKIPCAQGNVLSGGSAVNVSAEITHLKPGITYRYQLVANSQYKQLQIGEEHTIKPQGPPVLGKFRVSEVNTDGARLSGSVSPQGDQTSYHFEYGTDEGYGQELPLSGGQLASPIDGEEVSVRVTGLTPGQTYHYRLVATNGNGTIADVDHEFKTFDRYPEVDDSCPNALVRKQTGASLLLDCRAYELVSASNAGGYNVESDLIPGEAPLAAHPAANGKVIYSLHYGMLPGVVGEPTNFAQDPYVAKRGPNGWTTSYVGIPAGATPSAAAFGSPLAAADGGLSNFAFGGPDLCEPCFTDGSTGIPVRLSSGALVQGMQGSLDPGPGAKQAGIVARQLSSDGTHLIFGSTSKFEPDGNSGEVTIYSRDLTAGTTQVISKTPAGATMTGSGIGELDISTDGSRVLLGRLVSTVDHPGGEDSAGNRYWHLYMSVGDGGSTIDVTPGTTNGVIYAGMTANGGKVFFSTADSLAGADGDAAADLYRADVGSSASTLALVSTGGTGSGCNPQKGSGGPHWNSVSDTATCDVVALSGGAGVASGDGTAYFLSPEALDGSGTPNGANLFVSRPGDSPRYVATLAAGDAAITDAVTENERLGFGDFQVTPNGEDAVFASKQPLTGYPNLGLSEVFRYEAAGEEIDCVSCAGTQAAPTGDTTLSPYGLNLSDDGRVFFTSSEPLVLRDSNEQKDVYEWDDGTIELISTGSSPTGSGLVSVSADGVDAYFFTRQKLAAEDLSGSVMKIYDARENGGFLFDPPTLPCQASDECHGAGTQAAVPPEIATYRGKGGQSGSSATGGRQSCQQLVAHARDLRDRAQALRRRIASAQGADAKQRLHSRAEHATRLAAKASRSAKRCRANSRSAP